MEFTRKIVQSSNVIYKNSKQKRWQHRALAYSKLNHELSRPWVKSLDASKTAGGDCVEHVLYVCLLQPRTTDCLLITGPTLLRLRLPFRPSVSLLPTSTAVASAARFYLRLSVSLCVCQPFFSRTVSKKRCSWDHRTWHRNAPRFILGFKIQVSRSRTRHKKHCRRGSLHSRECWLLLVSFLLATLWA